ncbi:MAG: Pregnancy-associated plasma protein-A [Bacteroidetes bacterium ADurb.Bin408]|nr:MAG: Pregnancy-associated plasma protein-A [Bacteroidetes bacterium ADurb.Bin408]
MLNCCNRGFLKINTPEHIKNFSNFIHFFKLLHPMKLKTAILFLSFIFPFVSFSQHTHGASGGEHLCGTDSLYRLALTNPEVRKQREELEKFTQYFLENKLYEQEKDVKVIPIVFHVIHNYGEENITKAQILDVVRIINEDFKLLNADQSNVISQFQGIIGNPQIEFRLARKDPNGQCTDGITRTVSTLTFSASDNVKDLISWNTNKYLNIWVVDKIESGAGGYSYLPGTTINANYRGIVVVHSQLGSIGTSTGSNFAARTLTHEIGHFFNLMHPWGYSNEPGVSTNCSMDDDVTDTPNTIGTLLTCNLAQNTCNSLDNVQNYMDYATCAIMFTQGQVSRMLAALNSTVGGLSYLWQPSNLIATGTNDGYSTAQCAPKADFIANSTRGCAGATINFTDLSYNADVDGSWTWNWTFTGGTPATSTQQNPSITYNTPGTYNVSLTAANSTGSTTKTKTQYIKIAPIGGGENVPVAEGFENASFPSHPSDATKSWTIEGTSSVKWERTTVTSASGVACIRLRNLNIAAGNVNTFTSPNIDMTNISSPINISFKVAYAQKNNASVDKLRVLVSKNCGLTWQPRYSRIGVGLATNGGAYVATNFVPTATQWREETVSINVLANSPNAIIQFEMTSEGGNNIYIDNINITGAVGMDEQSSPVAEFQIYPNPVSYDSYISFYLKESKPVSLRVYDMIGKAVFQEDMGILPASAYDKAINETIPTLKSGVYILELNAGGVKTSKKFVVLE